MFWEMEGARFLRKSALPESRIQSTESFLAVVAVAETDGRTARLSASDQSQSTNLGIYLIYGVCLDLSQKCEVVVHISMKCLFISLREARLRETHASLTLTACRTLHPRPTEAKAAAASACISLPIWPHKRGKKYRKCPVTSRRTIALVWFPFPPFSIERVHKHRHNNLMPSHVYETCLILFLRFHVPRPKS